MPSKGKQLHKLLKEKALKRVVEQFDTDKIENIHIEPRKESRVSRWREIMSVETHCFGLKSQRVFFPDIVFIYPLEKPVKVKNMKNIDYGYDFQNEKEVTKKVVVIECEVRANSQLLSGGLRSIGYRMLKEEHGQLLYLILAKFKDVKMANTDLFDEIWEFEKND